jgi:hypothetical protein
MRVYEIDSRNSLSAEKRFSDIIIESSTKSSNKKIQMVNTIKV